MIYQDLIEKKKSLCVVGLGYVGLPIALEFAKKLKVVGFDINPERVNMMQNNIDPSNELPSSAFEGCDITFTHKVEDLAEVGFFIVAVPTPINNMNLPDLGPVISASKTVATRKNKSCTGPKRSTSSSSGSSSGSRSGSGSSG